MVFECNPYNGEKEIFLLKLKVTSSFVDYYIVTESKYSHMGIQK
jgi:hypothetical protein